MVKQRMTALDVRASVEEMRTELQGLRLTNVYDIPPRTFLFKFGNSEKKRTLLLENGVRLHLTQLVREKPKVPTQFTLRLRKHVRAWRLDSVTQLQHDRTVDFRFGVAEGASYHIIVELFSKGNIVLTDHEYRIMLLLRAHKDDGVNMFVRELYPVTKSFEQQQEEECQQLTEGAQRVEALRREWGAVFTRHAEYETTRSTLSATHHFGPSLADHILTVTGVKSVKKANMTCSGDEMFEKLLPGMLEAWRFAFSPLPTGGYLISKTAATKGRGTQERGKAPPHVDAGVGTTADGGEAGSGVEKQPRPHLQGVQYEDFSPVLLAQYRGDAVSASYLPSFGSVCDAFFLYTEKEKIEQHNDRATTCVLSKKEKFERDHNRRIAALERSEEENTRKGELIIQNAEKIDEAIGLINGALAAGIQWEALRRLLKQRHAEGHPVAYMVHELFLDRNSISVLVEENDEDVECYEDEESKVKVGGKGENHRYGGNSGEKKDRVEGCSRTPSVIEVDLRKTAYANAASYFTQKKANRAKLEKTIAATAKAAAGAEKKGERLAAKKQTKKAIATERHRCWWEKFNWFRTSCGDLVLQGHDTQSTELLVRRIMRLGDVFVHSDVEGGLPCILRAAGSAWDASTAFGEGESEENSIQVGESTKGWLIHMISLDEAAAWCVCRSSAWESKFSVGAWWVHASQIVGGTAAGCYLLSGEKNYLRPRPLMLGCGLLFRISSRAIDPREREELPNYVPDGPRQPHGVSHHSSEGDKNMALGRDDNCFLERDAATALRPLPQLQANRRHRQNTHQQQHSTACSVVTKGSQPLAENAASPSVAAAPARGTGVCGVKGAAAVQTKAQQLTKHQRKKLKKIQQKYKDQDDEDRLTGALLNGNQLSKVQLELLASERAKQTNEIVRTSPAGSSSAAGEAGERCGGEAWGEECVGEVRGRAPAKGGDAGHLLAASPSCGSDGPADNERTPREDNEPSTGEPQPRSRAIDSTAASLEATRAANDAEFNREWIHFTAKPQPGDCVEYAVAVCAPMGSVISYKYRAELSCGNAKKGQVALSLIEHFTAMALNVDNASEVHALRSLEMNDVIGQLRGNLKRISTGLRK
ncbi:translation-associated element 2, putative [Trypanosoma equiperdum]|uniref:Translation-associated element 2, putative n=1 Tax=Trypanosoma equiperdum TaxID=5694 RepID=A0A1G4I1S6_TRYEQ|nr:translation-associated element 2, putative [Trypanosoma equiperdum]